MMEEQNGKIGPSGADSGSDGLPSRPRYRSLRFSRVLIVEIVLAVGTTLLGVAIEAGLDDSPAPPPQETAVLSKVPACGEIGEIGGPAGALP